jgi:hypothetical protein
MFEFPAIPIPPEMPYDDEPLPPTANAEYDKAGSGLPALSWPDACAEVARAFLAACRGGPPVLKPVGDDEPLPLPGWEQR